MSAKTKTPLVSVMIPVYNRENYIGEAISSVLSQSYHNLELIVHDDASTDRSWEIIKSFSDPRLRAVRTRDNHGMIGGWNYLFQFAKGEYFKQMGSDDLLLPECLSRESAALTAYPAAAVVTCRRRVIDGQGKVTQDYHFAGRDTIVSGIKHAHWILTNLRENKIGEPAAVMFRGKLVPLAGMFDPQFSQFADFEYWLRLLRFGDLIYLNEPLVSFRQHEGSNTAAAIRDGRFITEIFTVIDKYYKEPFFVKTFQLTKADELQVRRQKTLDTLKNIKDLVFDGHLSQAFNYFRRLSHQVSLDYMTRTTLDFLLKK